MSRTDPPRPPDPYARAEYRRLIAWGPRIEREAPFLRRQLEQAPQASVVDLGCGSGEHVAFFAQDGCRSVGLDRSDAMIESAREHEARGQGRFVLGDALAASAALEGEPAFGLALSLGNMLPHLVTDVELARLLAEAHRILLPGGRLLVQLLNYERILERGVRHLPLNLRAGDGAEEIVFLRLMKPTEEGQLLFFPTTLVLDADAAEPVRVKSTRRVPLRPWTRAELEPALAQAGFSTEWFGDMQAGPFDRLESNDLILVATR